MGVSPLPVFRKQKALQALKKARRAAPSLLDPFIYVPPSLLHRRKTAFFVRAGLLALGSTDSLRLPTELIPGSGISISQKFSDISKNLEVCSGKYGKIHVMCNFFKPHRTRSLRGVPCLSLLKCYTPCKILIAGFVPDHSGGTTPDFHGIPY